MSVYIDTHIDGKIRSLSLDQLYRRMPQSASQKQEGISLMDVSTFIINGGLTIIDDTMLSSTTINLNIGPGMKDGDAVVAITATNKRISIFNQTGATISYYVSITQSESQNNQGYGKTFAAKTPSGSLILTTPNVQMNGASVEIKTAMTDSGILNAYIVINITPMISPAYNPNTIITNTGDSGYVNITNTYNNYPVVIDNTNLGYFTTIAIDKSVVQYNPTHLNITVKSGFQSVFVNNNTSYPAAYSITVTDSGIVSLYEGTVTAGQYIPGMSQSRFIEGEFIDISIQPVFNTQFETNALLKIVGVQITGQVMILDSITNSNVIPATIFVVPTINYVMDINAQYASSVISGNNGTLILDVTDTNAVIPTVIFLTSSVQELDVMNNSTSDVDVRYYDNDLILEDTYNSTSADTPYPVYYNYLYDAIYTTPPLYEDPALVPGDEYTIPDGGQPEATYLSAIYYPPGYGEENPDFGMIAIFTSPYPEDVSYTTFDISVQQLPAEIEDNKIFLNNSLNTQLSAYSDPGLYRMIVDPVIIHDQHSQSISVDGFVGVIVIDDPSGIVFENATTVPAIIIYDVVTGTSASPVVSSSNYIQVPSRSNIPITIPPGTGSVYISFSLINAKSNFIVVYASLARGYMYDPTNISATDSAIDNSGLDISTTVITPIVLTSPILSITPDTVASAVDPITLYVNSLNSIVQIENQTGSTLTYDILGNSMEMDDKQLAPIPILFGVFALAITGNTMTISIPNKETYILNSTLFIRDGLFIPTVSQLQGYINLQYGSAETGILAIPSGLAEYTPFIVHNTQQRGLGISNNTGSPLTISLAVYTVSSYPTISTVIPPGGSASLGNPMDAYLYYHDNMLSGIIVS